MHVVFCTGYVEAVVCCFAQNCPRGLICHTACVELSRVEPYGPEEPILLRPSESGLIPLDRIEEAG
jgi:hypothetical protein